MTSGQYGQAPQGSRGASSSFPRGHRGLALVLTLTAVRHGLTRLQKHYVS